MRKFFKALVSITAFLTFVFLILVIGFDFNWWFATKSIAAGILGIIILLGLSLFSPKLSYWLFCYTGKSEDFKSDK